MELNVSKNTLLCQSSSFGIDVTILSIRRLLQQQILASGRVAMPKGTELELKSEAIPLNRLKHETTIIYRCAIAFRVARRQTISPAEIAKQFVTHLTTVSSAVSNQPQLDFTVRIVEPGWIDFNLSDRALAVWLQQLLEFPIPNSQFPIPNSQFPIPYCLFPIQYAHARCCSLLRLGHRESLIQLHDPNFSQPIGQWLNPNPIPWFSPSLESGNFQLVHPTEKQLIFQLLAVVDRLEDARAVPGFQLAAGLSQAFSNFERSCRICGEVKQKTPELSQARLGLIAITQLLLRSLLQKQIGIAAPTEL
ncbi:MAG: DALR anticodon-binding domain-containing protein [Microcystaceae cyanobacterium]